MRPASDKVEQLEKPAVPKGYFYRNRKLYDYTIRSRRRTKRRRCAKCTCASNRGTNAAPHEEETGRVSCVFIGVGRDWCDDLVDRDYDTVYYDEELAHDCVAG